MPVIEVVQLRKSFGSLFAIDGIDLQVEPGTVLGFLGPNGAGKTTMIKILTTLLPPTGGSARVLGFDVQKEAAQVRKRIGVVQQQPSGDYALTVEEQLELYGLVWDVPRQEREKRVKIFLNMFDLVQSRNKKWGDLSIGTRRRVQIAREFMHDMDLLFLDEPTVGLDPIARRMTLDMIRTRVKEGLTVFFTTHILEEAEYLCDRVAIINKGRVVADETPKDLKEKFGGLRTVELRLDGGDIRQLVEELRSIDGVSEVRLEEGGVVKIDTADTSSIFRNIANLTQKLELQLLQLNLREPTLEEAFVRLIDQRR